MLAKINTYEGVKFMQLWGVESWEDPGAEYVVWDKCCVFALVQQDGFIDIHMAMDKKRWRDCRRAGSEILELISGHLLRAIILPDRPHVCNYAAKMGFTSLTTENLTTKSGATAPFFIMWREPGEYHGRCD